jgi:tetratricopeptide (TPR) repeat protein
MLSRIFLTLLLACLVATMGFAQEATKDRFVDNANGTVTDNQTGLMWQKEDDGTKRPYDEAVAYCKALRLGGFADWRLPKPDEVTTGVKREFYRKPREDAATALSYEQVTMIRQLGVEIQGADRYWTADPNDIALFNVTPVMEFHTLQKASKGTPLFVRAVRYTAARKAGLSIEQVRLNPKLSPFIVKDIMPQEGSYMDSIAILASSSPEGTTVLAKGKHGRYGPDGSLIYPMGDGTLYTFYATFEFESKGKGTYQFTGDGEDPLMFALIKPVGFAYLGGKGKVILPNDKPIILPPQSTDNYLDLGVFYFGEGELDAAIVDFDKAIDLDPKHRKAYTNRAGVYLSKGDYVRAIADCDRAIELDPNSADTYTIRGTAYASKRDFKLAMPDFDRAAELDPENAWVVLYNKALTCEQGGLLQEAILAYQQFLEKSPATETARVEKARSRIRDLTKQLAGPKKAP